MKVNTAITVFMLIYYCKVESEAVTAGIPLHRKAKSTIRQQLVLCQNKRKHIKTKNMAAKSEFH